MSICDEGWGKRSWCPCRRYTDDEEETPFCGFDLKGIHDPCHVAPLLKALPTASEEQIEAARLILDFTVRPRVHRVGETEFLTYQPQVKREVPEREKGGE